MTLFIREAISNGTETVSRFPPPRNYRIVHEQRPDQDTGFTTMPVESSRLSEPVLNIESNSRQSLLSVRSQNSVSGPDSASKPNSAPTKSLESLSVKQNKAADAMKRFSNASKSTQTYSYESESQEKQKSARGKGKLLGIRSLSRLRAKRELVN